ncbi:hypothetical protein CAEBREN_15026 [Caenorhabditis brenneri]|uniref:Uncharacterized protein n=1 Tax=Caenorhabditis brenneri TaxID=135651 RepID=G0N086_CAEBE|nr:hypothetical protein CAEBREN_15026 [Caenorhabditis brenneri]
MSRRNDDSRRRRKSSRGAKKHDYPAVSFDGQEFVDIPADECKSPAPSHYSLASNPSPFKNFEYMDEIALLKRGRITKDAPKHPYDRRGQCEMSAAAGSPEPVRSTGTLSAKSPGILTFMGGAPKEEKIYKIGEDGELKVAKTKGGGIRYEVCANDQFTVFTQSNGQTCLFTYRN